MSMWEWAFIISSVLGTAVSLAMVAYAIHYHRKMRVKQPLGIFLYRYLIGDYIFSPIKWFPGFAGMAIRTVFYKLAGAKIGRRVTILEGTHVINLSELQIGDNSGIGYECFIEATGSVKIGSWVRMGPRVSMFTTNHNFNKKDTLVKQQGYSVGAIEIGDDVWLGANATIVSNVRIGRGAVIGAGAVVVKDVPDYAIAAGNPAKVIRYRE